LLIHNRFVKFRNSRTGSEWRGFCRPYGACWFFCCYPRVPLRSTLG
jgi:hypothetical protein